MLTALIGVVGALSGTIFGSLLTQWLQRRNVAHARLHEARLAAYGNFATAIMEYRKALMDRWFMENEGRPNLDGHDVYETRSAAWSAYFQVALVASNGDVVLRAQEARDLTSTLKNVTTRAELNDRGAACRAAVGQFAAAARQEVALAKVSRSRNTLTAADI